MNLPEDLHNLDPDLERQLTQALRPVAPPDGFADRVMARAQPVTPIMHAKVVTMKSRRAWASGAIAAALLAVAFLAQQTHERRQRERAELAQQQFEAGIRITDQTLEHVRQQLLQAGVPIGN